VWCLGNSATLARARLAASILRRMSSPLAFQTKRLGFSLRAARKVMIASASSRVEAKLFSVMNGVSSPKKRSTKFIHEDEVGV